jgi:hypothetical protein
MLETKVLILEIIQALETSIAEELAREETKRGFSDKKYHQGKIDMSKFLLKKWKDMAENLQ